MRKIVFLGLTLICLGLIGCAGRSIPPDEAVSLYGALPDNYKELVMARINQSLIDPTSALFSFTDPPVSKSKGWHGMVYVNAKNRFGGYAGNTLFEYIIANGQVTHAGQHVFAGVLRGR